LSLSLSLYIIIWINNNIMSAERELNSRPKDNL